MRFKGVIVSLMLSVWKKRFIFYKRSVICKAEKRGILACPAVPKHKIPKPSAMFLSVRLSFSLSLPPSLFCETRPVFFLSFLFAFPSFFPTGPSPLPPPPPSLSLSLPPPSLSLPPPLSLALSLPLSLSLPPPPSLSLPPPSLSLSLSLSRAPLPLSFSFHSFSFCLSLPLSGLSPVTQDLELIVYL